jgi:hypothetical protein
MSTLFIHAQDARCHSYDEGSEYDSPEAALAVGVRGAVAMLADEVSRGSSSSAVEISIRSKNGSQLLRSVITLIVSSLLPESGLPTVVPFRKDFI